MDITIEADAFDHDGNISKVDFTLEKRTLARLPRIHRIEWTDVPVGIHTLVAKATDNDGAVTSSVPVTITVSPPPLGSYYLIFDCHHENTGVGNTLQCIYQQIDRVAGTTFVAL